MIPNSLEYYKFLFQSNGLCLISYMSIPKLQQLFKLFQKAVSIRLILNYDIDIQRNVNV